MKRLIAILCLALAASLAWAADPTIGETPEIKYTSTSAPDLYAQALNLNTPLYIYEYLRDNAEFALYHGSVSGSVNTYGGMRGNDVDLASTLIAMLRARNVPTRYVVGTVKLSANQLMNWLGVQNATLAASLLNDVGIQGVTVNTDGTVSFEHTWVEALVPYDNYRGIRAEAAANCAVTTTGCQWIPLDPAFKQKQYGNLNIDLHDTLNFDYTAYYNAIKNNDQSRLNKNPLDIFEDQSLAYLRANRPGTTLEDVANPGIIQAEDNGLLPASLPYAVVGTPRRYNSVADHDAQVPALEPKKWAKYLDGTFTLTLGNASFVNGIGGPFLLAELATKQLTITVDASQTLVIRLGGVPVPAPVITIGGIFNGQLVTRGAPFSVTLNVDAAPSTTGGADTPVTVTYNNLQVGGYYLIATGGESSNLSQVHRAAQQLLTANQQYPIVFNPSETACQPGGINCTPYVDLNGNGWDAADALLANSPAAMDALTGNLLYVAGTEYYTKLREKSQRVDALNHTKTPINAYVGMVSSFGNPEYIAGTAFSILPGGLLIDMKGIQVLGSWRIAQPSAFSSKVFKLIGHVSSALEHETWQALTGYDAVSTVRGIQVALANDASLYDVTKSTLPAFYAAAGFSNGVAPAGFIYQPIAVFSNLPAIWFHATRGAGFDLMKSNVDATTSQTRLAYANYADLRSAGGIRAWAGCAAAEIRNVGILLPQADGPDRYYGFCQRVTGFTGQGGPPIVIGQPQFTTFFGQRLPTLAQFRTDWLNRIIPVEIGQSYFNIFDIAQGFVPTDYIYRTSPPPSGAISTDRVAAMRNTVSLLPSGYSAAELIIPSLETVGSTYRFAVYILNAYDLSGNLTSSAYSIANNSVVAGGGYVDGRQTLNPATSTVVTAGQPTYNNAVFTNQNTIAQTNNDLVKTASTIDPVSTVTGNNFHDETDIMIKGRGLNVALTRTYNSAPSSTALDGGLGYGWTHSYMMRLKSNDYGGCPNCSSTQSPENGNSKTSSITYTDERGGDHNYLVNESTLAATPPTGEFDQLILNQGIASPGAALVAVGGSYTIVFRNGTRYEFANPSACNLTVTINCSARLLHIDDAAGNLLTFNYDANSRLSSVTDNIGTGRTVLTFAYDATSGHLTSVTDLASRVWQYGYDTAGNLTAATNPVPATSNYTYYSGTHNLKDVALPELRNGRRVTTTFSYYQNGRAFNYKDLLGNTETLDYDLFRRSTRVTDPRGGVRSYEYDQNGALTRLTEPDGGILLFNQNPDGLRYQKYDALGYGTNYSYRSDRSFNTGSDTFGNVTREQDALAQNIDRDYGLFDQISRMVDRRGVNTYNDYYATNGAGGVIGKLQAVRIGSLSANGVTYNNVTLAQYSYNSDGTPATKTEYLDPASTTKTRVTTYTWGNNGLNLDRMSVAGSGQTVTVSYGYDNIGRKTSETLTRRASPLGGTVNLTSRYQYDVLDRVTLMTDAVGNQVRTIYDKNGKVYQLIASFKRPNNGYQTRPLVTRSYDAVDRLVSETDTSGITTQYLYDAAGNLITVNDGNRHRTQYQYDALNRRTAMIDANGYQTRTVFDLAGRPLASINPLGRRTTTSYDALSRPIKITDALGYFTSMAYDQNGNLTCLTDANANAGLQPKNTFGCSLYRQYDELNRPVLEVNAEDGQTKYVYDLFGNVLSLTDPLNHAWTFAYDNLGRQTGATDPAGKSQSYQVDEAGNTWQKTDRLGRVTNYTYDNLNRQTRADYLSDNSWETFGFDFRGDLTEITNSVGVSYTYSYDALHRMDSKTDNRTNQSLSYVYDAVGNPIQKTTYTGDVINYQYDPTNRLTSEQSSGYLQASYQYDGAGRLLTRTLSSGAQTAYVWDDGNRLTQISNSSASGAPVSQTSYSRDNLGNIMTKTEGASVTVYTYDALYRLKTVDAPGTSWDEAYTYDKVGNRLSLTRNGAAVFYDYDAANRLTKTHIGSATGPTQYQFTYDFEGNLLTKTNASAQILLSLNWNAKNQPTNLNAAGKNNSFTYDPNGYRVAKTDSLGNKTYLLEGEHLEAVYSGQSLQAKFLRGSVIDEVVNAYQYDSNGVWTNTTYHHDPLTSVVGLSGHNGDVYNLTAYAPFGEIVQEAGPIKNFLKYTAREQDQDSGLYQYRERYYDPSIGRFISEDPLGFAAGDVNFYQYVGANPVNGNDPTGTTGVLKLIDSAIKFGGRLGSKSTRELDARIAQQLIAERGGGRLVGGGGGTRFNGRPQEYLPPQNGGRAGGAYPDGTLVLNDGKIVRFNTVDTLVDGVTLSKRELSAYYNIRALAPLDELLLFAKRTGLPITLGAGAAALSGGAQASPDGLFVAPSLFSRRDAVNFLGATADFVLDFLISPGTANAPGDNPAFNSSGAAGGGFLLYPNKANLNMTRSVYAK